MRETFLVHYCIVLIKTYENRFHKHFWKGSLKFCQENNQKLHALAREATFMNLEKRFLVMKKFGNTDTFLTLWRIRVNFHQNPKKHSRAIKNIKPCKKDRMILQNKFTRRWSKSHALFISRSHLLWNICIITKTKTTMD